ncbi:DUF6090 family protein [Algoriphagus sp. SE2]|uniref:DUF6090 family protein n=1 Tax=Algoriphagus sp. SE2 TaxID=3141536 RepID=UPI0031CD2F88
MIKFFRKIRQKLLSEGNTGKYLKYAVGEILLVMVGILLALQMNNWNEERKNYEGETIALMELRNEFERNYNSLLGVLDQKKKAQEGLYNYLSLLSDDSKTTSQKAKIERGPVAIVSWDSGNAVLNSLLSTGNIEYIKNDSLKYLLHDWNREIDSFDEHAIIYKDIVYELLNYEKVKLPIRMVKEGKWNYTNHSNLEIQEFREAIVDDFRYHNLLINCVNGLDIQIRVGDDFKEKFGQIINLLDTEIQKR